MSRERYTGPCVADGCEVINARMSRKMCMTHYTRFYRTGQLDLAPKLPNKGSRTKNDAGYIVLTLPDGRRVREHRKIMEDHLGRELLPEETVHHINGIRDDNRLENLELWSCSQPPGQRVKDKIAWAEEILRLYKKDINV